MSRAAQLKSNWPGIGPVSDSKSLLSPCSSIVLSLGKISIICRSIKNSNSRAKSQRFCLRYFGLELGFAFPHIPQVSQFVPMLCRSSLTASQGQKLRCPLVHPVGPDGRPQPCTEVWSSMKCWIQQNLLKSAGRQMCPFAIPEQLLGAVVLKVLCI